MTSAKNTEFRQCMPVLSVVHNLATIDVMGLYMSL